MTGLLVKPVKSALSYMTEAVYELPYDGAKEIILDYSRILNEKIQL